MTNQKRNEAPQGQQAFGFQDRRFRAGTEHEPQRHCSQYLPNAKGDLYVQIGILRSQVNISDLVLIQEAAPAPSNNRRTGSSKLKNVQVPYRQPGAHALGKTVDEALAELDKYSDDAYLAHIPPGAHCSERHRCPYAPPYTTTCADRNM